MKCLVHACCGPCALASTRKLADAGLEIDVSYDNSNIQPRDEYLRRLEVLRDHVCGPRGYELYEGVYDPDAWEREVGAFGSDRERRCRACYRLRLRETARRAAELGYGAISTTLTISPYQFTDVVLEELRAAAREWGLEAVDEDFSDLYAQTTRESRELGMYRQNYCGCRFSVEEAAREREAAREKRRGEKRGRQLALEWMAAQGCVNQVSKL